MKIKRLRTSNFRSIATSDLEFGDFTLLSGVQGSGKTSHLDAICAALTGRTRLTDRRGAGIRDHIRLGQAKCEISIDCQLNGSEPDTTIRRTVTPSAQQLDVPWGKNLSGRQAILIERLGVPDEAVETLLDPRLFADRSVDEQSQVLLKLLREPTIEVPAAARAVGIQSLSGIQQVDDQIKSIKDGSIRSLNAVIKNLEETAPAEPTAEDLSNARVAAKNLADLDAEIQKLTVEIKNGEFVLSQAESRDQEVARAREVAGQGPDLLAQLEKAKAELQRCSAVYKEIQGRDTTAIEKNAEARSSYRQTECLLNSFSKIGEKCPTCLRKIAKSDRESMVASLTSELKEKEKGLVYSQSELDKVQAELNEAGRSGSAARKEVDSLQARYGEVESARHLLESYKSIDVASINATIADLTGKIQACQIARPPLVAASEAGVDAFRRAEEFKRIAADLASRRAQREQYLMAVESLVALKDSILGGEGARKLQDETSRIFEAFFPGTHVILSPEGASVAPAGSSDGTPVAHLSGGQKVIFDVGLRIAAAKTTGFNLMAIDDANKLAPSARQKMLEALMKSGVQVIMCSTGDKIGAIPGATVYSLSNPSVWGPTKVERVNGK